MKNLEDKKTRQILIGIGLFLLVWMFASCTTLRNAERRHDRIVKNFPSVHKSDTVEVEKVDTINIPGVNGTDTLYFTVNSIDTIRDTFFLNNEVRVVNTIWRAENGKNALKTEVSQPDQKVVHRWKEKRITIYEKTPINWYQEVWFILIFSICTFFFGWKFSRLDEDEKE